MPNHRQEQIFKRSCVKLNRATSVLADGQIAAASPNVGTDWVFFQTNGAPSEVPMSFWAVSTRDSSVRHTIQPFADLSFDKSFSFSMGTYDPVNSRVYIADAGAGYLAGLSFDPATGFERLWQEDQTTFLLHHDRGAA